MDEGMKNVGMRSGKLITQGAHLHEGRQVNGSVHRSVGYLCIWEQQSLWYCHAHPSPSSCPLMASRPHYSLPVWRLPPAHDRNESSTDPGTVPNSHNRGLQRVRLNASFLMCRISMFLKDKSSMLCWCKTSTGACEGSSSEGL